MPDSISIDDACNVETTCQAGVCIQLADSDCANVIDYNSGFSNTIEDYINSGKSGEEQQALSYNMHYKAKSDYLENELNKIQSTQQEPNNKEDVNSTKEKSNDSQADDQQTNSTGGDMINSEYVSNNPQNSINNEYYPYDEYTDISEKNYNSTYDIHDDVIISNGSTITSYNCNLSKDVADMLMLLENGMIDSSQYIASSPFYDDCGKIITMDKEGKPTEVIIINWDQSSPYTLLNDDGKEGEYPIIKGSTEFSESSLTTLSPMNLVFYILIILCYTVIYQD